MKQAFFPLVIVALLAMLAYALTDAGQNRILPVIVRGVEVSGNYGYLAVDGQGLRIVDVSDPASPSEVGFYNTPGGEVGAYKTPRNALGLAVSGSTAYIADGPSGLRIFDISNPSDPTELGFYDTPGNALGLAVSENTVYVADGDKGLRVIDVSNPAPPVEVGWVDYLGSPSELEVVGNYAYVAVSGSGLGIVDTSNPANPGEYGVSPNIVGYYYTQGPGTSQALALAGHFAYLADGPHGLRIIDLSDPADPRVVGSYDTPGSAYDVVVAGNTAYIADWDKGLRIIDISDPTNPTEVGFYQRLGLAGDIALIDYVLGIFTLAGLTAALLVHWLSWFTRLRYSSVAVVFGLVVISILATLSLLFMFPDPGSGADGAYVLQSLSIGVWALVFPTVLMIGTLQARSLPAPWWKGVLSMFFEAALGFVLLVGFNSSLRWYIRMPDTGLSPGEYQDRFILSFMIVLVALAVIRPIVRMSSHRLFPTGQA